VTTLLCVSKKEFFLKNWPPIIEICVQRFRDKALRHSAMLSVSRLLWVYLFRSNDPSIGNAQRRVETLLKILFPPKTRAINPSEVSLDMFVRVVYIVLVKYSDAMLELFMSALLGIEPQTPTGTPSNGTIGSMSTLGGTTVMSTISAAMTGTYPSADSLLTNSDEKASSQTNISSIAIGDAILNPERLIIAMRSFLLLLADMEDILEGKGSGGGSAFPGFTAGNVSTTMAPQGNGFVVVQGKIKLQSPPFPALNLSTNCDVGALINMRSRVSTAVNNSGLPQHSSFSLESTSTKEETTRTINAVLPDKIIQRLSNGVRDCLDRINQVLGKVAVALDKSCGNHLCNAGVASFISGGSSYTSTSASSTTTSSTGMRRASNPDLLSDKQPISPADAANRSILYDLMRNYLDCLPRYVPTGQSATRIVEMMTRYTFHTDEGVATAAIGALERVSEITQGESDEYGGKVFWSLGSPYRRGRCLVEGVVKVMGEAIATLMNDRPTDMLATADLGDEKLEKTGFGVFISMLEKWHMEMKRLGSAADDGEQSSENSHQIVAAVEGYGLVYILSSSPAVRRLGVKILKIAKEFEVTLCGLQVVTQGGMLSYVVY
jgi:hypothetical protein